jgi:hypothetical protein
MDRAPWHRTPTRKASPDRNFMSDTRTHSLPRLWQTRGLHWLLGLQLMAMVLTDGRIFDVQQLPLVSSWILIPISRNVKTTPQHQELIGCRSEVLIHNLIDQRIINTCMVVLSSSCRSKYAAGERETRSPLHRVCGLAKVGASFARSV